MNKLQNAVNLIGRTGINPTIRTFENGVKLAKFSLATNETIKEVNGKKTLTRGVRVITVTNAGDAGIYGFEAELVWAPTSEIFFQLGFNWMDAEIVSGEFKGDTPAHTPKVTINGIARYDADSAIIGGFKPFVQVDFNYSSEIQFILPNHPGATQEAYTLVNLRFGLKSQDDRWEIAGWIKNVGDKLYRSEVFGPGSGFLPGRIHYGAPKLAGISLSFIY